MSNEEKKTLPIHEFIPVIIEESIREEQPGRFLTLLKVVEGVKFPKGHEEIRRAVTEGGFFFGELIKHRCEMAEAKLYIEEGEAAMKEMEETEKALTKEEKSTDPIFPTPPPKETTPAKSQEIIDGTPIGSDITFEDTSGMSDAP